MNVLHKVMKNAFLILFAKDSNLFYTGNDMVDMTVIQISLTLRHFEYTHDMCLLMTNDIIQTNLFLAKLILSLAPLLIHKSLKWHYNERDGVSNHWHLHCLLNCWFRCRSKKTSKLHVTGHCAGDSPVTGEFPAQKASNMENISIWWRHYVYTIICIHISSCVILTPMCTLKSLILIAIGIYKPFTVSARKSNCGINGIINV